MVLFRISGREELRFREIRHNQVFLCIERGIGENRFSLSVAAKIGIIFVNTKNKIMFFEHVKINNYSIPKISENN